MACGVLFPWPGIKPAPLTVEAWSLNHWPTREVAGEMKIVKQSENIDFHLYCFLLLLLSCFSRVRLCATPQKAAHQASRPWDSPGKNTGVGCHFLLQCMKVNSESEVTQSYPTLVTPWTAAHQAPLSMGFSRQKCWSGVPLPSTLPLI